VTLQQHHLDRFLFLFIACQPEFFETTNEVQYGVIGRKAKISLQARGYPIPTVHWYLGEEKLQYGDRYNTFVTPNGEL